MNLGNQPVEILIEDVYLLVVPSSESSYDPEEEERRAQAAKAERLENAELLHVQGQAEQGMIFCYESMQCSHCMTRLATATGSVVFTHHEGYQ